MDAWSLAKDRARRMALDAVVAGHALSLGEALDAHPDAHEALDVTHEASTVKLIQLFSIDAAAAAVARLTDHKGADDAPFDATKPRNVPASIWMLRRLATTDWIARKCLNRPRAWRLGETPVVDRPRAAALHRQAVAACDALKDCERFKQRRNALQRLRNERLAHSFFETTGAPPLLLGDLRALVADLTPIIERLHLLVVGRPADIAGTVRLQRLSNDEFWDALVGALLTRRRGSP